MGCLVSSEESPNWTTRAQYLCSGLESKGACTYMMDTASPIEVPCSRTKVKFTTLWKTTLNPCLFTGASQLWESKTSLWLLFPASLADPSTGLCPGPVLLPRGHFYSFHLVRILSFSEALLKPYLRLSLSSSPCVLRNPPFSSSQSGNRKLAILWCSPFPNNIWTSPVPTVLLTLPQIPRALTTKVRAERFGWVGDEATQWCSEKIEG